MVDPESVRRRLREIDRRLSAIRTIAAEGEERFLSEDPLQTQAERHVQLATQAAIDVAVHIVAEDSPRTPEDYGSSFIVLAEIGVIDRGLAEHLRAAAGLRNILVHGYLDVDPNQLWLHLGRSEDLTSFASAVEAYLTRES